MDTYLYTAVVTTTSGGLRLRATPGNGSVITTLPKGATVYVKSESNPEWPLVEYNGLTGYCSAQYLSKISADSEPESNADQDEAQDANSGYLTWGIFIPCESQAAALQFAVFFNVAHVCQKELRD